MDSVYFANGGSRDQLNTVISLSNLSAEGKEMFFREFKDQIKPDRRQSTGYMITNGTDFTPIHEQVLRGRNLTGKTERIAVIYVYRAAPIEPL